MSLPFRQGEFAQSIGVQQEQCPYPPNSHNGSLWLDGWYTSWAMSL